MMSHLQFQGSTTHKSPRHWTHFQGHVIIVIICLGSLWGADMLEEESDKKSYETTKTDGPKKRMRLCRARRAGSPARAAALILIQSNESNLVFSWSFSPARGMKKNHLSCDMHTLNRTFRAFQLSRALFPGQYQGESCGGIMDNFYQLDCLTTMHHRRGQPSRRRDIVWSTPTFTKGPSFLPIYAQAQTFFPFIF